MIIDTRKLVEAIKKEYIKDINDSDGDIGFINHLELCFEKDEKRIAEFEEFATYYLEDCND